MFWLVLQIPNVPLKDLVKFLNHEIMRKIIKVHNGKSKRRLKIPKIGFRDGFQRKFLFCIRFTQFATFLKIWPRYGEIVMVVTFHVQRHVMIRYDHWSVTTFSINDKASMKKLYMKNHAYMITLSPSKHALWLGDLCM